MIEIFIFGVPRETRINLLQDEIQQSLSDIPGLKLGKDDIGVCINSPLKVRIDEQKKIIIKSVIFFPKKMALSEGIKNFAVYRIHKGIKKYVEDFATECSISSSVSADEEYLSLLSEALKIQ